MKSPHAALLKKSMFSESCESSDSRAWRSSLMSGCQGFPENSRSRSPSVPPHLKDQTVGARLASGTEGEEGYNSRPPPSRSRIQTRSLEWPVSLDQSCRERDHPSDRALGACAGDEWKLRRPRRCHGRCIVGTGSTNQEYVGICIQINLVQTVPTGVRPRWRCCTRLGYGP